MITKTSTWFETTIRQATDGKPTKRQLAVKAETFTEAEAVITGKEHPDKVLAIKTAGYTEVVFDNKERWYKSVVAILSMDEKTGKTRRGKHTILVNADSLAEAATTTGTVMGDLVDWEKVSITETKIENVYE